MNDVKFTFIRHAAEGDDSFSINLEEYGRCYLVGLEIAKLGKVDAIYSSFASRALATALILRVAADCPSHVHTGELDENAKNCDLQAIFTEVRTEAQNRGWKHVVFVMHLPCLAKIGVACLPNLDFFSVDNAVVNYEITSAYEIQQMSDVKKKYPELNGIFYSNLPRLGNNFSKDGKALLEYVKKFHKFRNWQAMVEKIKVWKKFFLQSAGITNLDETADWTEILIHPACEKIDIMQLVMHCIDNLGAFTPEDMNQLCMLPEYVQARNAYTYFMQQECFDKPCGNALYSNLIAYGIVKRARNLLVFEADALVGVGFADMMKGVNPLIVFPDWHLVCSFSYREHISPLLQEITTAYETRRQNNDLPF